jgi:hypothetical protein
MARAAVKKIRFDPGEITEKTEAEEKLDRDEERSVDAGAEALGIPLEEAANLIAHSEQQDHADNIANQAREATRLGIFPDNIAELDPITQQGLKRGAEVALEEYMPNNGTPIQYQAVGNSVFLYPTPNYNASAALKIYFTRGPNYFAIGDIPSGTKVPGFNALFHQLLSLWPAYDYCITNLPELAAGYFQKIQLLESSINDFYGLRFHDSRPRLTVSTNQGGGSQSGVIGFGGGDSNK